MPVFEKKIQIAGEPAWVWMRLVDPAILGICLSGKDKIGEITCRMTANNALSLDEPLSSEISIKGRKGTHVHDWVVSQWEPQKKFTLRGMSRLGLVANKLFFTFELQPGQQGTSWVTFRLDAEWLTFLGRFFSRPASRVFQRAGDRFLTNFAGAVYQRQ